MLVKRKKYILVCDVYPNINLNIHSFVSLDCILQLSFSNLSQVLKALTGLIKCVRKEKKQKKNNNLPCSGFQKDPHSPLR